MTADGLTSVSPLASTVQGRDFSLTSREPTEDDGRVGKRGVKEPGHTPIHSQSRVWAHNGQAHSFDGVTTTRVTRPGERSHSKARRSQSAKHPTKNGHYIAPLASPVTARRPVQPPSVGCSKDPRGYKQCVSATRTSREKEVALAWGSTESGTISGLQNNDLCTTEISLEDLWALDYQSRKRLSLTSLSEEIYSNKEDRPWYVLNNRRPSLDRTDSLELGDLENHLPISQADEGYSIPDLSPSPPNNSRVWDSFEEHLRTIHDSSDMFAKQNDGPSFQASSAFQETMVDLYGYPDYPKPPPAASLQQITGRSLRVSGAVNRFLGFRKRASEAGGLHAPERAVSKVTVENAKRGWRILRQYVHDNFLSKRTSQASLTWCMLRQTVKGMSDTEKTRQDLYQRYGIIPSQDSEGKVVMVNSMLSERAQKATCDTSKRLPLLYKTNMSDQRKRASFAAFSSSPMTLTSSTRSSADWGQRRPPSSVGSSTRAVVRPHSSLGSMGSSARRKSSREEVALPRKKFSEPIMRSSRSVAS